MSGRSKSPEPPLPREYATMSADEVASILNETIPDAPLSIANRWKRYWGVGTVNYHPDPRALEDARRRAHIQVIQGINKINKYSVGQNASSAPNPNAGPFDYKAHYRTSDNPARPRGYPLFPIRQHHIQDAERQVNHIRAGYNQYRDYIEKSNAIVAAEAEVKKLKDDYAKQEREHPEAYKYPDYNTDRVHTFSAPPLTPSQRSLYPPESGGKSKRVKRSKTCKSKRVKRSKTCKNRVHKRRN